MNHNGAWLDAGTDALEAQGRRNALLDREELKRLRGTDSAPSPTVRPTFDRLTLSAAAEKYFSNCEKRGLDSKTVRKYRAAVEPFIRHCGVTYADECQENKQPLLDYMGWLRKHHSSELRYFPAVAPSIRMAPKAILMPACLSGFPGDA